MALGRVNSFQRALKGRNPHGSSIERVSDPDFNDASAWSAEILHEGSWEVADGKLTLTNFRGSIVAEMPDVEAGAQFDFEVVVESYGLTGLTVVQFVPIEWQPLGEGTDTSVLWTGLDPDSEDPVVIEALTAYTPTGSSGRAQAVEDGSNKLRVTIAFSPGNLVVDRISIKEISI